MEKFGQVYIRKIRGDKTSELVLLPSTQFSNLDHKWYYLDGNMHPEYNQYRGNQFSLRFQSSQYDKNGLLVHFEGDIFVPIGLGDIGSQDFESIEKAQKEDLEIVRRFKLVSNDSNHLKLYQKLELPAFLAACYPGCKLDDCKIQRIINILFFTFDDDMEKLTHLKLKEFDGFLDALYVAMNSDTGNVEKEPPTAHTQAIPESLLKYVKFIKFFEKEISIAEKGSNRGKYVRDSFFEYIQATCVESCQERNEEGSGLYEKVQKELRIGVAGAVNCLEVGLFDANIQIKPQIRNTCLFKWFLRLMAEFIAWTNDVISYRKESEAGRATCNTVYLLHNYNGLPLVDAMQTVLDNIRSRSTLLVETGRMLCEFYSEDENVQRFVEKAKGLAYGTTQWHTITDRYRKDFKFHCVVE